MLFPKYLSQKQNPKKTLTIEKFYFADILVHAKGGPAISTQLRKIKYLIFQVPGPILYRFDWITSRSPETKIHINQAEVKIGTTKNISFSEFKLLFKFTLLLHTKGVFF